MAKTLPAEHRERRGDAEEDAFDVDVDHRFPVVNAMLVERRDWHDAGITDQYIEPAVSVGGQRDEFRQVAATADVGHLRDYVITGRQSRRYRVQLVGAARTQHELGAPCGEKLGCRLANPAAGAGDRHYFAVNRHRPEATRSRAPKLSIVASIDLNADLGEGFGVWRLGDDDTMLGIVSSANVACGFHAGDPAGLLSVCRLAAERGVRIGAQVSYRDLAGFGRRFIDVTPEDLLADVVYQIGALHGLAQAAGSGVSYVKPHGALYNTIMTNHEQAAAVAEAVKIVDPDLPVLGLAGSCFFDEAGQRGLRTVAEAFADRAYQPDGQLVSRREPGAVLDDASAIAERVLTMVTSGTVSAIDGSTVTVSVESVCVHGDSPGAVQIATAVRERLKADGIDLKAFC
jgi:5-oxoprolinase (ATP-hydrolysing) subunit A